MQLGPAEILVVLVIALLVFGPKKLPEVGRQVGRAMKEFRQFQHMMSRDFAEVFDDSSASAEPAPTLPPKTESPKTESPKTESPKTLPPETTTIDVPANDLQAADLQAGDLPEAEVPANELPAANDTGAPPDPEADA